MIILGENIRKHRKLRNITQEQLAQVFGVSEQAVSRWENGATYPDIELLPTIALYFGISLDELLGMEKREEFRSRGEIVKSYEMLREAVKRYPKNYGLLRDLADDLIFANVDNDEIWRANLHEAEGLIDRILAECTNEQLCRDVTGMKVYLLNWLERTEEAIALAEKSLPGMEDARESYMKHLLSGEKKKAFCREYLLDLYVEMVLTIEAYADINCEDETILPEERIKRLRKAIDLTEFFFEGNFAGYNSWMAGFYRYIAAFEALKKNADATIVSLEKAVEYAIAQDTLPKEIAYTSTLLRGDIYRKEANAKNYTCDEADIMVSWLKAERYDFIRDDARFKAIETLLAGRKTETTK